jgi:hypothetical protein
MSTLRAQVDHVVDSLNDIHVMLDHNHRVAGIHEPVETFEKAFDIGQMQARCGLIEDIDRMLGPLQFREFGGNFDPLPRRRESLRTAPR